MVSTEHVCIFISVMICATRRTAFCMCMYIQSSSFNIKHFFCLIIAAYLVGDLTVLFDVNVILNN